MIGLEAVSKTPVGTFHHPRTGEYRDRTCWSWRRELQGLDANAGHLQRLLLATEALFFPFLSFLVIFCPTARTAFLLLILSGSDGTDPQSWHAYNVFQGFD